MGLLALLTACAHHTGSPSETDQQGLSPIEQERLGEIEQQYMDGHYEELISALKDDLLLQTGSVPFKSESRKYLAFSHCSLGDKKACQGSFQELLEDDPGYRLSPAENTHPQWGPIFSAESMKVRSTRIWIKQDY